MKIALTGATGFVGRYILQHLVDSGHACRCWRRAQSDTGGIDRVGGEIEWIGGELGNAADCQQLVADCDAVVHAALFRPGEAFQGGEGDIVEFAGKNILGTLQLIEAAREAGAKRFVFISTCAVHEKILDDRPLDETHPLWPRSHYGAHKAALEKFVHSYGLGYGDNICALRPTGVYGLARPADRSKWYELVRSIVQGETVECRRGGKEVHAADVAKAVGVLLSAEGVAGEAFNCYDRYVSHFDIATITKQLTGSTSEIVGGQTRPQHEIDNSKLRSLGMNFGGTKLLEETVAQLVQAAKKGDRTLFR